MRSADRRSLVAAIGLILSIAAWLGPATAQPGPPVTVFAAASLKNVLDDVNTAYAASGHPPARISYAASSALARQIEQGAPADLFVSADSQWMDYLAARKLIVPATRGDLLSNHLALVAPKDSTVNIRIGPGMPLAAALGGGRLAVAGPDVPAGKYAQASLTALGVWDSVKDQLAPGESVRAALAFVARGETPLGIVYDTDARIEPRVRIVGLFPDSSHPPIVYPAALTTTSTGPGARAFLAFLRGQAATAVFRRYGFIVLNAR